MSKGEHGCQRPAMTLSATPATGTGADVRAGGAPAAAPPAQGALLEAAGLATQEALADYRERWPGSTPRTVEHLTAAAGHAVAAALQDASLGGGGEPPARPVLDALAAAYEQYTASIDAWHAADRAAWDRAGLHPDDPPPGDGPARRGRYNDSPEWQRTDPHTPEQVASDPDRQAALDRFDITRAALAALRDAAQDAARRITDPAVRRRALAAPQAALAAARAERDLRRAAAEQGSAPEAVWDGWRHELQGREVAVRVTARALASILKQGRFKTFHETDRTRGGRQPEGRLNAEERLLGVDRDAPAEQRPVSGYLHRPGVVGFGCEPGVRQYGTVRVVLARPDAQIVCCDALDHTAHSYPEGRVVAPSPLHDPQPACCPSLSGDPAVLLNDVSYAEALIPGPVKVTDIARVDFLDDLPSAALARALARHDVPWTAPNGEPYDPDQAPLRDGTLRPDGLDAGQLAPPGDLDARAVKHAGQITAGLAGARREAPSRPSPKLREGLTRDQERWVEQRAWELHHGGARVIPAQVSRAAMEQASPRRRAEIMLAARKAGAPIPAWLAGEWEAYGRGERALPIDCPYDLVRGLTGRDRRRVEETWRDATPLQRVRMLDDLDAQQREAGRAGHRPWRERALEATFIGVPNAALIEQDAERWRRAHRGD